MEVKVQFSTNNPFVNSVRIVLTAYENNSSSTQNRQIRYPVALVSSTQPNSYLDETTFTVDDDSKLIKCEVSFMFNNNLIHKCNNELYLDDNFDPYIAIAVAEDSI